jgi:hypothetical protein
MASRGVQSPLNRPRGPTLLPGTRSRAGTDGGQWAGAVAGQVAGRAAESDRARSRSRWTASVVTCMAMSEAKHLQAKEKDVRSPLGSRRPWPWMKPTGTT